MIFVIMTYVLPGILLTSLTYDWKKKQNIVLKGADVVLRLISAMLVMTAVNFVFCMFLYGMDEMKIYLSQSPAFSFGKIAMAINACLVSLLLGTLGKWKKLWILGCICIEFILITPALLDIYQQQMIEHIVINEVCSDNFSVLPDTGGYYPDYIELYNPAYVEVPLSGLRLSDSKNTLDKFVFPEGTEIEARGYLLVYATKDKSYDFPDGSELKELYEQEYHADFKISASGEKVYLTSEEKIIDMVEVPALKEDESFSRTHDGDMQWEVLTATPGQDNTVGIEQHVDETITEEIPRIYLTGNIERMTKVTDAHVKVKYVDGEHEVMAYARIQQQGASTVSTKLENKGSYNIKLYEDPSLNRKKMLNLGDWGEHNKYCLKANLRDHTQAKNIVGSRIWGEMMRTRDNVDEHLQETLNGGAIDGYPIIVYLNGECRGLYTLNLPKEEWTFGMGNGEKEAMFFTKTHADSTSFQDVIDYDEQLGVDWNIKYCSTEDDTWARESMNEFIRFVIEHDGQEFVEGIDIYLDVDAAIDYLIFIYMSQAADNIDKNMIWITFDGTKWIPSVYDLDHTWENYVSDMIPTIDNGRIESGLSSVLWQRLMDNYSERIANRYFELKKGALSEEQIQNQFITFMNTVPEKAYELEYPDTEHEFENQQEAQEAIFDYVSKRAKIFDVFFADVLEQTRR